MKAVRKIAPEHGLNVLEVEEPGMPGPDEVMVEVLAAGICGSDVHVYQWGSHYDFMRERLPLTLGHEFCGRVAALGPGVTNVSVGDFVAPMPTMGCLKCAQCAAGFPLRCPNKRTVGLTRNGAFARFVHVPAVSCIPLRDNTDPVLAALLEPLCVGDNALDVGEVGFGDTVLVLGPGTIGQAIARGASWRGASRVVVVGMDDEARLRTAKLLGATDTIDLAREKSLSEAFFSITRGREADVVFEATGHPSSISDGLNVLRMDGILVATGIHASLSSFDVTRFVRRRQQIRAAHGSRRSGWERMAAHIANAPQDVRPFVSLELPLEDAIEGFQKCVDREASKVILLPQA